MSWDQLRANFNPDKETQKDLPRQATQNQALHKAFSAIPSLALSQDTRDPPEKKLQTPDPETTAIKRKFSSGSQQEMDDSFDENEDFMKELVSFSSQFDDMPMDTGRESGLVNQGASAKSSNPSGNVNHLSRQSKKTKIEVRSTVLNSVALPQVSALHHSVAEVKDVHSEQYLKEDTKLIKSMSLKRPYSSLYTPEVTSNDSEDDVHAFTMTQMMPMNFPNDEEPVDYPQLQEIVNCIPKVPDWPALHLCFQKTVDLSLGLLTSTLEKMAATRTFHPKTTAYQTHYNWWDVKSLHSNKTWYSNERSPLLRMSLATLTDILRSPSNDFGLYDDGIAFKTKVFELVQVGALTFVELSASIDSDSPAGASGLNAGDFISVNLSQQQQSVAKRNFPLTGPFDMVDCDPMSEYGMIYNASTSSTGSPLVQLGSNITSPAKEQVSPTKNTLDASKGVTRSVAEEEVEPNTSKMLQFLHELFKFVDAAVAHPEAHIVEGILCASLNLVGELGADQNINDGGLICRTFCRCFELTLSPNILLTLMKTLKQLALKNRMALLSVCRMWQSGTDSHRCFLLSISKAIEYILDTSGEKKQDIDLEDEFCPPGQEEAPFEYRHQLLTATLQFLNSTHYHGPWYSKTEKKSCASYTNLRHTALKQAFLGFYEMDCQLLDPDETEMMALHILYKIQRFAESMQVVLGDLYHDAGDFIGMLLKYRGTEMDSVHVSWAKHVLQEEYSVTSFKTISPNGLGKMVLKWMYSSPCLAWRTFTVQNHSENSDDSVDSF